MKLYVASSWKNASQGYVVKRLRDEGHQVFDFKEQAGFCQVNWNRENIRSPGQFLSDLDSPELCKRFNIDYKGMQWADGCVMVLECGKSAHLELGWFLGKGKPGWILLTDKVEPELMYNLATDFALTVDELCLMVNNYDK